MPSSPPPYEEKPPPVSKPTEISPLITTQPGVEVPHAPGTVWVPLPAQIEGVPPGLEYLTMVDTIVVQQHYEFLEYLTGHEYRNKYSLKNANGEQVYYAEEKSDSCERQCYGPQREFDMHITDNFKREVIKIHRKLRTCSSLYWCKSLEWMECAQECSIESPPGNIIGSVLQRPGCAIKLDVKDASGNTVFHIDWPWLLSFSDRKFTIYNVSDRKVGVITKKWRGFFSEAFTDADVFCVNFPMDLNVHMKALLLGATFLIICDLNGQQVGMITKQWGGFFREMVSDADVFCVSFPMNLDVRMKAALLGVAFLIDLMAFETSNK